MYFDSLSDLVHMSGHGFYVWLAYGISLTVLIGLYVQPLRKKAQILKGIKIRMKHEQENA